MAVTRNMRQLEINEYDVAGALNGITAVDTEIVVTNHIREGALWFDLDADAAVTAGITVNLYLPSSVAVGADRPVAVTEITFTADANGDGTGWSALLGVMRAGTYVLRAISDDAASDGDFTAKLFGFT